MPSVKLYTGKLLKAPKVSNNIYVNTNSSLHHSLHNNNITIKYGLFYPDSSDTYDLRTDFLT